MKTREIRVRDPFIVLADDTYYLYKSENDAIWVHKSTDLENWSKPTRVYELTENSWGVCDLWAPEVHLYRGKYYMFLSLLGKHGLRGTEISVADTPVGPFVPLTNSPATPPESSCIDGTLFVDGNTPYIVYSADWPHQYDPETDSYIGAIWAVALSEDLTERKGEPFLLFRSVDAPCAKDPNILEFEGKPVRRYGSDAPFVQKLSDGRLYLTWSPYPGDTYIVASAVSDSGNISGPWRHLDKPLFDGHGGHAMFFTDKKGQRNICLHQPECPPEERALILPVKEENGLLSLV